MNLDLMTRCPACYADLGVPPAQEPDGRYRSPSLLLRLHGKQDDRQWQISTFDRAVVGASAGFVLNRVRWVYRICGDGHIFFDHLQATGVPDGPRWMVDRVDAAAAVGGAAAGKSYLVVRTLSQQLTPIGLDAIDWDTQAAGVNRVTADDWLEGVPMNRLVRHYSLTEREGRPMDVTALDEMVPLQFLADNIATELVEKIMENQQAYADPDQWGRRIRQPIVRRYLVGNGRRLSVVADLPGELFDRHTAVDDDRQRVLRNYGTLMWVVDPVVAEPLASFLPQHNRDRVIRASMRLADDVNTDYEQVRRRRASVQTQLAAQLAEISGHLAVDLGGTQHVLVCLTKADLFRLALDGTKTLHELGRRADADWPGDVVNGVARYLLAVASRSRDDRASLRLDEPTRGLIDRIAHYQYDLQIRTRAALQIARAIVDHYADQTALWNLAHIGGADIIKIPAGYPGSLYPSGRISVPTLDRHLVESLRPGEAGALRPRDLVMSALTCGLVYGLGFGQQIEQMLQQPWRELRFFLCSPLGDVPEPKPHDQDLFQPVNAVNFTDLTARSSGLSQLLLCLLRRLRP